MGNPTELGLKTSYERNYTLLPRPIVPQQHDSMIILLHPSVAPQCVRSLCNVKPCALSGRYGPAVIPLLRRSALSTWQVPFFD